MALAVNFRGDPLRCHGSMSSVAQPFQPQYPGYFWRRPLVRQNIQRRSYPIGYSGTLGNFPYVVCGVDDDDEHKLNAAVYKSCGEDDNDEKETVRKRDHNLKKCHYFG